MTFKASTLMTQSTAEYFYNTIWDYYGTLVQFKLDFLSYSVMVVKNSGGQD